LGREGDESSLGTTLLPDLLESKHLAPVIKAIASERSASDEGSGIGVKSYVPLNTIQSPKYWTRSGGTLSR
jgi:hypothetical protein